MKYFTYEEIKNLHLKVGSEDWANSRMIGRCGISQNRLKRMKEIRPDIPTDVLLFPKEFVVKDNERQTKKRTKKAKK